MTAAQREPQPASFRHTPWRLGETFLLLLAICASVQVWRSVELLSHDGENSFVEGGVALPALRLARGGPVYTRPDQPPSYTGTFYTPLYLAHARSEMRLAAGLLLVGFPAVNLLAMRAAGLPPHYGVLAEVVAGHRILSDVEYLAVQGKDPEMVDAWSDSLFQRLGEWSPAPVLGQIRSQQFDYIILFTKASGSNREHYPSGWNGIPDFSPSIVAGIERDYRLAGSCAGESVVVFVPKQEPRASQLAGRLAGHCGWR